MRWNKPNLRHSLHSLLGRDGPSSTAWVCDSNLEKVRAVMLGTLDGLAGGEVARMNMRIRYAPDMEALWYLRMDLKTTLTTARGEVMANTALHDITEQFKGLMPRSTGGA